MPQDSTSSKKLPSLLRKLWNWYWRLSRVKKVPVAGLVVAIIALPSTWFWNLLLVVQRYFEVKPDIQIGLAFYAYERGWTVNGRTLQTFAELRNLPANCLFYQIPSRPLRVGTQLTDLHAFVFTKFRFQNMSDQRITNLWISIYSSLLNIDTTVSPTPNVEAH